MPEQADMVLPDELHDESPFLRRQKAVTVRRARVPRRLRRILTAIAVLLPVSLTGYSLAVFALGSPCFLLNSADAVTVTGNRFASREEILNALGFPPNGALKRGINVFRLSLTTRRAQLEGLAWVRAASLTRVLPNSLAVRVEERTPVAFVNLHGRVGLVDGEGVLLDKPESASFDFPVLTGLEAASGLEERRARVGLYQQCMRDLEPEAARTAWVISEVDLADPDDVKALLVQDRQTLAVHFGQSNFVERFQNFLSLLPELRASNQKLDSVDLRYRNQIVVNSQPQASKALRASGAGLRAIKE